MAGEYLLTWSINYRMLNVKKRSLRRYTMWIPPEKCIWLRRKGWKISHMFFILIFRYLNCKSKNILSLKKKVGILGHGVYRPFICHIMQYNTCIFPLLQGNLYEFLKLTGWRGSKVLYFGDHIYSDLAVRNLISYFFVGYSVRPTYWGVYLLFKTIFMLS